MQSLNNGAGFFYVLLHSNVWLQILSFSIFSFDGGFSLLTFGQHFLFPITVFLH